MSDLTFITPSAPEKPKPVFEKRSGKAEKTNSSTPAQMQHELARYVVTWLGVISCIIMASMVGSYFLEEEKFKLVVPALISAISGIVGYIAGHTAKGSK